MYKIIHTTVDGSENVETEYGPMELERALTFVTVLNRDAIQNESESRWIVGFLIEAKS